LHYNVDEAHYANIARIVLCIVRAPAVGIATRERVEAPQQERYAGLTARTDLLAYLLTSLLTLLT